MALPVLSLPSAKMTVGKDRNIGEVVIVIDYV